MKKKIVIPRKDHETYFISKPPDLEKKQKNGCVEEYLHKMHPGFSPSSVFDVQEVTINSKAWFLVTVMDQETLTEYRILNPGVLFFTNTSLLVHSPDFIQEPVHTFSSEVIGFNKETAKPESLPQSGTGEESPENSIYISTLLKKASAQSSVFKKHLSRYLLVIPIVLVAFMIFLCLGLYRLRNIPDHNSKQTMERDDLMNIPGSIAMLADISDIILGCGGIIRQWQYSEITDPSFVIHIEGADPGIVSGRINDLDYIFINNISDIQYSGKKPQYILSLSFNTVKYKSTASTAFENDQAVLLHLNDIREKFAATGTVVLSEILSSRMLNNSVVINVASPAVDFVKVLETVEQILEEKNLCIQQIDVSLDSGKGLFLWSCSIIPYQNHGETNRIKQSKSYYKIPAAFGYSPLPVKTIPTKQAVISNTQNTSEHTKIGTIYDADGSSAVYYRNKEGKIIIQED